MDKQKYNEIIEALTDHRKGVSDSKREDYTKGSSDVLANFKSVAESTGVSPLKVWLVYANKHWDAICNYVKSEGQSESEPIKERFGDLLNYLELGWGLIKDSDVERVVLGALELNDEDINLPRKAKIIARKEGHNFDIGEDVVLTNVYRKDTPNEHYRARNERGKVWHVNISEIALEGTPDREGYIEDAYDENKCCEDPYNCDRVVDCTCSTGRSSGI